MNHLELFAEYRTYLFRQAYRRLGTVMDAEDLLQETFLRWQQTTLRTIRSPKAFLTTVVRNLCRNHLQSARLRHEEPLEQLSLDRLHTTRVFPDEAEQTLRAALAPALRFMLERLSPKERLVFLLREVFDYEYDEIAAIVRKNSANCRQMVQRARKHISASQSRFSAPPEQLDNLVSQFVLTCTNGDLRSLVVLLS
ncbi:MAG TPA: sigma-70 family RNA polymerase sigma factor [Pyrinomonadaceae bacterium]|nr:sigma-70 family RNA polymerase sigma factor [Pyrinomonadaceae bacterium]